MAPTSSPPALPWAAVEPQPDPSPRIRAGLELKVCLCGEACAEDGWMRAVVHEKVEGQVCGEGRQLWILRIEGDEIVATFLSDRRIADLNTFTELYWREPGEDWAPPPPPEFITAEDLAAAEAAWTRRLRVDVCDAAMCEALADAQERFPDVRPEVLADSLRESMDHFQKAMEEAAETVGEDGVFGEEQVALVKQKTEEYVAALKEKRQRGE